MGSMAFGEGPWSTKDPEFLAASQPLSSMCSYSLQKKLQTHLCLREGTR